MALKTPLGLSVAGREICRCLLHSKQARCIRPNPLHQRIQQDLGFVPELLVDRQVDEEVAHVVDVVDRKKKLVAENTEYEDVQRNETDDEK